MSERVPRALREEVIARARHCCEYCGLPNTVVLIRHQPDHIISTRHGGKTALDNLAYACYDCNHLKSSDIASIDPQTGAVTRLFHPRIDRWHEHFRWNGARIEPLSAVGRATVSLLRFNDPQRVTIRANLMRQRRYPFAEQTS